MWKALRGSQQSISSTFAVQLIVTCSRNAVILPAETDGNLVSKLPFDLLE